MRIHWSNTLISPFWLEGLLLLKKKKSSTWAVPLGRFYPLTNIPVDKDVSPLMSTAHPLWALWVTTQVWNGKSSWKWSNASGGEGGITPILQMEKRRPRAGKKPACRDAANLWWSFTPEARSSPSSILSDRPDPQTEGTSFQGVNHSHPGSSFPTPWAISISLTTWGAPYLEILIQ